MGRLFCFRDATLFVCGKFSPNGLIDPQYFRAHAAKMGVLKTFLAVMILALPVEAGEGAALPQPNDQQLRHFATCAGRLSALMEHQWLVDGPASEKTAQEVHALSALIQAIMVEGENNRALAWRIEAKVAQRALLMQVDFGTDKKRGDLARNRSDTLIGPCRAMLLS